MRASVSFFHALSTTGKMVKANANVNGNNGSDRFMEEGCFMLWCGKGARMIMVVLLISDGVRRKTWHDWRK